MGYKSSPMRLKDRNTTPVGGFYYIEPDLGITISTQSSFDSLVRAVRERRAANMLASPDNLAALIEDQICTRQPANKCYYTSGLGDRISQGIHAVTQVIDSVAGTELTKKARGCSKCAQRRNALNSR